MSPNPQETADLVAFTETILDGKLKVNHGDIILNKSKNSMFQRLKIY